MDTKKVSAASKALKKYLKTQENVNDKSQLFEDDGEFIYMVIKSKRFFASQRNLKPQLVELPHSLWSYHSEKPDVCCFVRDPQRDYKDALLSESSTPIKRCIGVSKLKGKFKPYEARRTLTNDYDVFLAEDHVVPMLPKLLGKSFYGKQQYVPIPLKLKSKSGKIDASKVGEHVTKILNSTILMYTASQILTVRIATTKHSDKEIAANAAKVLDRIGLDKVICIDIKTNESPSLPVYYVDQIYGESDIGEENDPNFETEGQKRKRDEAHLDELLAEIVDEDEIKDYNREQRKLRKQRISQKNEQSEIEAAPEN